uniref:NADH-ubiquinone oxidoreductase chain 1 n=1 Tax=Saccostrea kegaki TaxID=182713 RepID=A0A191TEV9_9BIVA|nr:NADH dehydrogenase subunit 1 [Saccostrea kegaki]ANI87162.1 NADH dehydrogenase subunit 1 [Saccostrea kegaki]
MGVSYYLYLTLTTVFVYLGVLLSVAYFTLMERKSLSSFGVRLGPDKTSFLGFAQPITDGVKLFMKELVVPANSASVIFLVIPSISLMLCLLGWQIFPSFALSNWSSNDILFFLVVSSLNAHIAIMSGWSSNSKYAGIGGVRGFAQVISYEICLSICLIVVVILSGSMSFFFIAESGWSVWWSFFCPPVVLLWLTVCLAEANRAPFDLVEAESELVSGFNTEYSAGGFALLFIAEYGMILLLCSVTVFSFFQTPNMLNVAGLCWAFFKVMLLVFFFIWSRAALPRLRYDFLMMACWASLLPFILGVYCLIFFVSKV